jgi:hypothetical protein
MNISTGKFKLSAVLMRVLKISILSLLLTSIVLAQDTAIYPSLSVKGYVKEMPSIQMNQGLSDLVFSNLIHNRINLRLNVTQGFHFAAEARNRLFTNELISEIPMVKTLFEYDHGLADLSWVWLYEDAWLGHTAVDRLYADWRISDWQIRAGRQRINWGINLVSNPNDLFNTYSFFDFDYEERPGADAIRIQHFLGGMSRVQLAVSPAENSRDMVAAAMLNLNRWNYDFQTLAGYFRNRAALGGGWAGHIKSAGFKGEATWFYDLEKTTGLNRGNLVTAIGFDYMFGPGTFGVVEFLYNGGFKRNSNEVFLVNQPLRPDNIMFSEYAITLSAQHPFSAVLGGGLALMALPDIEAAFVMPSVTYSLMTNFDLQFLAQIFTGGRGSVFKEAGSAGFFAMQYSF